MKQWLTSWAGHYETYQQKEWTRISFSSGSLQGNRDGKLKSIYSIEESCCRREKIEYYWWNEEERGEEWIKEISWQRNYISMLRKPGLTHASVVIYPSAWTLCVALSTLKPAHRLSNSFAFVARQGLKAPEPNLVPCERNNRQQVKFSSARRNPEACPAHKYQFLFVLLRGSCSIEIFHTQKERRGVGGRSHCRSMDWRCFSAWDQQTKLRLPGNTSYSIYPPIVSFPVKKMRYGWYRIQDLRVTHKFQRINHSHSLVCLYLLTSNNWAATKATPTICWVCH